jgi:hypothetical protein
LIGSYGQSGDVHSGLAVFFFRLFTPQIFFGADYERVDIADGPIYIVKVYKF